MPKKKREPITNEERAELENICRNSKVKGFNTLAELLKVARRIEREKHWDADMTVIAAIRRSEVMPPMHKATLLLNLKAVLKSELGTPKKETMSKILMLLEGDELLTKLVKNPKKLAQMGRQKRAALRQRNRENRPSGNRTRKKPGAKRPKPTGKRRF